MTPSVIIEVIVSFSIVHDPDKLSIARLLVISIMCKRQYDCFYLSICMRYYKYGSNVGIENDFNSKLIIF